MGSVLVATSAAARRRATRPIPPKRTVPPELTGLRRQGADRSNLVTKPAPGTGRGRPRVTPPARRTPPGFRNRPGTPAPPAGGNLPNPPAKRPPLGNLASSEPTEVNLPAAPARKPIEPRLPTPKPTKAGIVRLARPKVRETTNPLPSQRLMSHLESKSPLMKQAATRGRQYAHRRGLLNSSLAAEASQEAVISKGLEIAQADTQAALEGDRVNLQRQEQADRFEIAGKQLKETGLRRITDESIARDRLALDTEHYRTSTELADQRLALDESLGRGRLQLDTAEFTSREAIARDQLALAIRQQLSNEDLAFYRANLDKAQLEHQIHVGVETLKLNREKFHSDEAYRNGGAGAAQRDREKQQGAPKP